MSLSESVVREGREIDHKAEDGKIVPGLGNVDREEYVQVDELQYHRCVVVGRWKG